MLPTSLHLGARSPRTCPRWASFLSFVFLLSLSLHISCSDARGIGNSRNPSHRFQNDPDDELAASRHRPGIFDISPLVPMSISTTGKFASTPTSPSGSLPTRIASALAAEWDIMPETFASTGGLSTPMASVLTTEADRLTGSVHEHVSDWDTIEDNGTTLERARRIVEVAQREMAFKNKMRMKYEKMKSLPPLYVPNVEVLEAATLVAEANAAAAPDAVGGKVEGRELPKSFWMGQVSHKGTMPWGDDPEYNVFRNVIEYGATGNGLDDDSDAIELAMSDGGRCVNEYCHGSTTKNAIVYFPPGTYLVSRPIIVGFGTAMIGDANDWPIIKGACSFQGLGVVSTNGQVPGGRMWAMTSNFYRQVRNFKIDITDTPQEAYVCAIHHQIGQGTSLQYLEIISANCSATTQQGIYIEDGSGGVMSDITFRGGNVGMYVGNQQFTTQRLVFENVNIAIQLHWDWAWTFKSLDIRNCKRGIFIHNPEQSSVIGSVTVLDSKIRDTPVGIMIDPHTMGVESDSTSVVLDNVLFEGVASAISQFNLTEGVVTEGKVLLAGDVGAVDLWVTGVVYADAVTRNDVLGFATAYARSEKLTNHLADEDGLPNKLYFERARPQYADLDVTEFVHMKDYATGDGETDDTEAFQRAINENAGSFKILFVDAGNYMISDTINIPTGVKMVGEAWSQVVAYGPGFSDARNPRPLVRVGEKNETGNVELQDLLFTSKGPTAGLVTIEWNMLADAPGSAGMWDCHVRIGGAIGTELTAVECPADVGIVHTRCTAGSLMMHVTPGASGYFENMWLWVADHQIDDTDTSSPLNPIVPITVYAGRGLLVESQEPVWLYGTSVHHAVMYQYNIYGAKNVLAGFLHAESPYYQPEPLPPLPLGEVQTKLRIEDGGENYGTLANFAGDPNYSECGIRNRPGCDAAWGLIIRESQDVHVAGAGLYSWFQAYSQACIAPDVTDPFCQQWLAWTEDNFPGVRVHNLVTIGATGMLWADEEMITAKSNRAVSRQHPFWSTIGVFEA
ncbi:hypothetical protein MKZ38_007825 [Zalerion maritima]|uniref:Rhamnogalacturonase A/B/Epimerase-like pectate lyase domain-containing protein n=1 Tax=Zalerion maritima TaxID=339359 RepID=A0AAD5RI46_9PEZI|nr:hypothetical protein MKZ38_007825 [Zalerion maritima]